MRKERKGKEKTQDKRHKENPHPPKSTQQKIITTYRSLFFWKTHKVKIPSFRL